MEEIRRLADLIQSTHDDGDPAQPLTILAKRVNGEWTPNSPAIMIRYPEDQVEARWRPPEHPDFEYFLEWCIVQDVIEGRKQQRGVNEVGADEKVRVVIHYAEYDCWPLTW